MLLSAKLVPTFDYPVLEQFWRSADDLGFHSVANYDHLYGLTDPADPTFEGWTTLAAMATVVRRARVSCMVTSVTFRNPAVLAKMAVTVDHISGGRLDLGIGAGWHEDEHHGYGLEFPSPGARVAMLDEALTVIRRLWSEDLVTFSGRFFALTDARGEPKPVQRPRPPIIVGGAQPKMLRVIARHADEWNMLGSAGPDVWQQVSVRLDEVCAEQGRNPAELRRSVQLLLHPDQPEQTEKELGSIERYRELGCQHVVLSFYRPPSVDLLRRCAELH